MRRAQLRRWDAAPNTPHSDDVMTNVQPDINIYGPVGLRELIRTTLRLTQVTLAGAYAVHELVPLGTEPGVGCAEAELHVNEAVGRDVLANEEGVWPTIVDERSSKGGKGWVVSAGPLVHRGMWLHQLQRQCRGRAHA